MLVALPASGHELVERLRYVELAETSVLDHVSDRLQAHLIELVSGRLDEINLCSLEKIKGGLVPVADAVDRVEEQALRFDDLGPVGAGRGWDSEHRHLSREA